MNVTYLNHSGFLLEWEHSYWLFDYYKGEIPALNPEKDILVFCSHSHHDHFNPVIFNLANRYPSVIFIFSEELRQACENKKSKILFLEDYSDTNVTLSSGEMIQIHALKSTDLGCAFLIHYNEKNIFHAGDLHWWYWEGEDNSWNQTMTEDYKHEIDYLNGKTLDLAFTVLDPRQEKDYALGMNHILTITKIKHLFPMHFWGNFDIIKRFISEHSLPANTCLHTPEEDGQSFEIML
jgi:L-ascorbate metabolism protein UlaG (beta-lactamase superfamily)